ncbi:MAG: hypothetical protein ACKPFA_09855, partial [Dolichospermum sp.]
LAFFFVVGRFSFFHLTTDLFATGFDTNFVTFSDNCSAVFGDSDTVGFALVSIIRKITSNFEAS